MKASTENDAKVLEKKEFNKITEHLTEDAQLASDQAGEHDLPVDSVDMISESADHGLEVIKEESQTTPINASPDQ